MSALILATALAAFRTSFPDDDQQKWNVFHAHMAGRSIIAYGAHPTVKGGQLGVVRLIVDGETAEARQAYMMAKDGHFTLLFTGKE